MALGPIRSWPWLGRRDERWMLRPAVIAGLAGETSSDGIWLTTMKAITGTNTNCITHELIQSLGMLGKLNLMAQMTKITKTSQFRT